MTGNDLTVVIDTMDEERVESLLRMFAEVD